MNFLMSSKISNVYKGVKFDEEHRVGNHCDSNATIKYCLDGRKGRFWIFGDFIDIYGYFSC